MDTEDPKESTGDDSSEQILVHGGHSTSNIKALQAPPTSYQINRNLWECLLTLSPLILLTPYTLPYLSNPPFLNFDNWALALVLRTERQSTQKINNSELDQYGAEIFEQQQFGTAGIEGVK